MGIHLKFYEYVIKPGCLKSHSVLLFTTTRECFQRNLEADFSKSNVLCLAWQCEKLSREPKTPRTWCSVIDKDATSSHFTEGYLCRRVEHLLKLYSAWFRWKKPERGIIWATLTKGGDTVKSKPTAPVDVSEGRSYAWVAICFFKEASIGRRRKHPPAEFWHTKNELCHLRRRFETWKVIVTKLPCVRFFRNRVFRVIIQDVQFDRETHFGMESECYSHGIDLGWYLTPHDKDFLLLFMLPVLWSWYPCFQQISHSLSKIQFVQ